MRSLVGLLVLVATTSSVAALVPQQRGTPCDAAWDVGNAKATLGARPKQPWDAVCSDGDPRCDLDGEENGECRVAVAACAAVATEGCMPATIRKVVIPRATRKKVPGLARPPARTAGAAILQRSSRR